MQPWRPLRAGRAPVGPRPFRLVRSWHRQAGAENRPWRERRRRLPGGGRRSPGPAARRDPGGALCPLRCWRRALHATSGACPSTHAPSRLGQYALVLRPWRRRWYAAPRPARSRTAPNGPHTRKPNTGLHFHRPCHRKRARRPHIALNAHPRPHDAVGGCCRAAQLLWSHHGGGTAGRWAERCGRCRWTNLDMAGGFTCLPGSLADAYPVPAWPAAAWRRDASRCA